MFSKALRQYGENLNDLRNFVESVSGFLAQEIDKQAKADARKLFPLTLALSKMDSQKFPAEKIKEISRILGDDVSVTDCTKTGTKGSVKLVFKNPTQAREFQKALDSFRGQLEQGNHLHRTTLISLICCVEWFLSSLLHTYYEKYPDAAASKEKQLSLNDLRSLGTVDDAVKHLIEIKVEDVLRKNFNDWLSYLKENLKLTLKYIEKDRESLDECFQRRNILVHNAGIVNTIYLSKVPVNLRDNIKTGDIIPVNKEYVETAIRLFEKSFILIGAELWKKVDEKDSNRGKCLVNLGYTHLTHSRWDIAENIFGFMKADKQMDESTRLTAAINYWQCLKWQNRFSECKKEVEDTDFSAKEDRYSLARMALLDQENEYFKLLPRVLKSNGISEEDLFDWPLFQGIRKTKTFKKRYGSSYATWQKKQGLS